MKVTTLLLACCSLRVYASILQQQCAADARCSSVDKPMPPSWIADPGALLSPATALLLNTNLTEINGTTKFPAYLAVLDAAPAEFKSRKSNKYAQLLIKEWKAANHSRIDRSVLIVVFSHERHIEIASGTKARKRLKDKDARKIARKAMKLLPKLEEGEEPTPAAQADLDAAATAVVKAVSKALKAREGIFSGIKGMALPILMAFLFFGYFMKGSARPSRGSNSMTGEMDRGMMGGLRSDLGGIGQGNADLQRMYADAGRAKDL